VQPTTRGNTIRDVGEFVGPIDLHEILENGGFDEIGMQFGYAIDLVGTHDSKEGHPDHLRLGLLNDRHPSEDIPIVGEGLLYTLKEEQVDIVNDLQVPGKKVLHQTDGPLLQSLGEYSVVGVAEL
jgi:hypothetical protein